MKTNRSCSRRLTSAVILFAAVVAVNADIPGGPGKILTPFLDPDHVTEKQVTEAKTISAKNREISSAQLAVTHEPVSGDRVGIAWARGGVLADDPTFTIQGTDPNGQKVTADFSEIFSILLISVERHLLSVNEVILECKLFPTITPSELVKTNPTYSQLVDDHTSTIRIRLPATESEKGDLCLVKSGRRRYEVMTRIADLKPNSEIKFGYGRSRFGNEDRAAIWWAIGSVIKDPRYPYKLMFQR